MHVLIAGTRGIPAAHGGFETFAQDLALYLVREGHRVTVFCQLPPQETEREDAWCGVRRIMIPAPEGPLGTICFDWKCVRRALRERGVILTLGSNTGIFSTFYRLFDRPNLMNMDGIEWKRDKWSRPQRLWLLLNELAGARVSCHLVADHPEIGRYLERYNAKRKTTMIPYGAAVVTDADVEPVIRLGLQPKRYYLVIARPEPENSIVDIVRGHAISGVDTALVMVGNYMPDSRRYHQQVVAAAGQNVRFVGAIYSKDVLQALRYHAKAYIHGHRVGGTNPSLVEALGAGNAVIAHDNEFTRWVAGNSAAYFSTSDDLAGVIRTLDGDWTGLRAMEEGSRARHLARFQQDMILPEYETLLMRLYSGRRCAGVRSYDSEEVCSK